MLVRSTWKISGTSLIGRRLNLDLLHKKSPQKGIFYRLIERIFVINTTMTAMNAKRIIFPVLSRNIAANQKKKASV